MKRIPQLNLNSKKMPTAIVTGATGILGREVVAALGKDPQWTKIYALSRSQKFEYPPSVQHGHLDLTGSAEGIAKELKSQSIEGEYLFFAAYLAKDDEKDASDVNGILEASTQCWHTNGKRCHAQKLP
jgi:NAD(P)-dependent dehydrogenase (short-subunit alcohol dehydrogenase family)